MREMKASDDGHFKLDLLADHIRQMRVDLRQCILHPLNACRAPLTCFPSAASRCAGPESSKVAETNCSTIRRCVISTATWGVAHGNPCC